MTNKFEEVRTKTDIGKAITDAKYISERLKKFDRESKRFFRLGIDIVYGTPAYTDIELATASTTIEQMEVAYLNIPKTA